jgi:hypothetical protein
LTSRSSFRAAEDALAPLMGLLRRLYSLALPLIAAKIKRRAPRRLTFMDHFTFRLMQSAYSRLETMSPVDYRYWQEKGWFERGSLYFTDHVRPNVPYDAVARLVGWLAGRQMDRFLAKSA